MATAISKITRPPAKPAVQTPVTEQFASFPSKNLTTPRMLQYLDEAERGRIASQAELMQDIMEKDPTITSAFETRSLAVQSKQWDILPKEGTGRKGQKQADMLKEIAGNLSMDYIASPGGSQFVTFDEMLAFISSAVPYGFAGVNLIWNVRDSIIEAALPIEHRFFIWGNQKVAGQAGYNPYELYVRTTNDDTYGERIEPYQFMVHTFRHQPVKPGRRGLLRTLAWWWFFKNFGVKSMVRYAERTGEPLRIGKYDPAVPNDLEIVKRAVKGLGTDAYAVVSKAADVEFIGHDRSTSNDIHTRLISLVNAEISKVILGHQSATEAEPGKLGNDEQKLQVQFYRIEADARAEEVTVNSQFIAPIARFTQGEVLCYFKRFYEAEEDLNTRAERYVKLSAIPGFSIPIAHLREEFDVPEPAEDEPSTLNPNPGEEEEDAAAQATATDPEQGQEQTENDPEGEENTEGEENEEGQNPAQTANTRFHTNSRGYRVAYRASTTARQRAEQALQAVDDSINEGEKYAEQARSAYRLALAGITFDTPNFHRAIRNNLTDFREKFEAVAGQAFRHSGRLAMTAFGGIQTISNNMSFDLADDPAVKFLNYQAFTVTVMEGEHITLVMRDELSRSLQEAIEKGWSMSQWHNEVLDRIGVGSVHDFHLRNIFRTNMVTAHSASKIFAMERNKADFPGWEYMAVIDSRTREDHAVLDGRIFSVDDHRYMPPLGFQCRCIASPISKEEMISDGLSYTGQMVPDYAVDTGIFRNNAVVSFTNWIADKMMEYPEAIRLIQQYEEEHP